MENDIIVAQATAKGPAPLAIIRFSGKNIRGLLDKTVLLKSKKKLSELPTHTLHYGLLYDDKEKTIDQVIILIMDSPRSFTGEDTVEITCHNNQFIIEKIIKRCVFLGARLAKPGEFSQRAVHNKKIDIFQAEAINELLHAENELITQIALSQIEGSLSSEISFIDHQLCLISAWCQASFEFLDEERDFRLVILEKLNGVIIKIDSLLKMHSSVKFLKEGVRVAIIGSVNVGKSSLFNFILGHERAIVNQMAGTTRDTIESSLYINNYNLTLIDTAGIRITDNEIEKEGIQKSYYEAESADILLLVYSEEVFFIPDIKDFYDGMIRKYNKKSIIIKNKIDLENNQKYFENELLISTTDKIGLDLLLNTINKCIDKKYDKGQISYIINARHVNNLNAIKEDLNKIKNFLLMKNPFYEIILHHLLQAQKMISYLSGKSIEERSLDMVFKEFCVGK
jgi:tRNA modification GTPase